MKLVHSKLGEEGPSCLARVVTERLSEVTDRLWAIRRIQRGPGCRLGWEVPYNASETTYPWGCGLPWFAANPQSKIRTVAYLDHAQLVPGIQTVLILQVCKFLLMYGDLDPCHVHSSVLFHLLRQSWCPRQGEARGRVRAWSLSCHTLPLQQNDGSILPRQINMALSSVLGQQRENLRKPLSSVAVKRFSPIRMKERKRQCSQMRCSCGGPRVQQPYWSVLNCL